MMKRFAYALMIGLAGSGSNLLACAVCGAGENDPTRNAYTNSTAFLSFVPLMAIGGVIYTVYRYVKKSDEKNSNEPQ